MLPSCRSSRNSTTEHRVKDDPSRDLGQYISLALLVGSPPDFKLTVPEEELPPDARDVAGFLPLLRTFYAQAKMLIHLVAGPEAV